MSTSQFPQNVHTAALDEQVWQAWLAKNRRQDAIYFAKRLKISLIASPFVLAALLWWLWKAF